MSLAWITGARGFLGRSLARHLADQGTRVAGIGHGHWPASDAAAAGVDVWVNGEIGTSSLELVLAQTGSPAAIYHLAGGSAVGASFANPLEDFERTVHTTVRLLEWIRRRCGDVPGGRGLERGGLRRRSRGSARPSRLRARRFRRTATTSRSWRRSAARMRRTSACAAPSCACSPPTGRACASRSCGTSAVASARRRRTSIVLDGTGQERRDWIHASDVARLLAMVGGEAAVAPTSRS